MGDPGAAAAGVAGAERELSVHLRETAGAAALEVGGLLRSRFGARAAQAKADSHDLVTEVDRLAEDAIRELLLREFPGSSVWGEEAGLVGGEAELTWLVDPIDGTNNFAAGVPFFCVSIAALAGDRLLAGVIYDPLRRELFAADLTGATRDGTLLESGGAGCDADAVLVTDFPGHRRSALAGGGRPDLERFGELVESFQTVRRLGSGALALAYVAAGRVDVTFGTGAHPWDVAAGALLVRQAGGCYRAFPGEHAGAPWRARTYAAHVAPFDFEGSSLAELAGLDLADPDGERFV